MGSYSLVTQPPMPDKPRPIVIIGAGGIINDAHLPAYRKAGINFQLRYAPFVLAARSLIEQGAIGQLHDMEVRITAQTPWHLWRFFETVPFVEVIYHSIHYLDLMRSFLGEPKGVYCKSVRHPKASKIDGTSSDYALDYGDFMRSVITTNHHHEYGLKHQESYIKWEGSRGAIKAKMGLMLNYPKGVPDEFEYCVLEEGKEPTWQSVQIEGTWFPDAFIGTMASIMRAAEGSADCIPTLVDDAYKTMALVDAACRSSLAGGTPFTSVNDLGPTRC